MSSEPDKPAVAKPEAALSCRTCRTPFLPSANTPSSCRYHTENFCQDTAQRWTESGDQAANYSAKQGGVKGGAIASFWNCCGATTADAPGCEGRRHLSYDDATTGIGFGRFA